MWYHGYRNRISVYVSVLVCVCVIYIHTLTRNVHIWYAGFITHSYLVSSEAMNRSEARWLICYFIWVPFLAITVASLLQYSVALKVSVYYCRLLNAVIIILIGAACDTFCTFLLTLPFLGIYTPSPLFTRRAEGSESTYPHTLKLSHLL